MLGRGSCVPPGVSGLEGRDLTFFASVSLDLGYHRGSASTIKSVNCEHGMLENPSRKEVHFFIASIWSSAKAGKGHLPQENIITWIRMLAKKRDSGLHSVFQKDFTLRLFLMAESVATVVPGITSPPWSSTLRMRAGVRSELPVTAYMFSESFS